VSPPVVRALRWLFALYAAATALHLAWVMAHEPFSFDAWNFAVATKAEPITVGRFFDFWITNYFHSNPRFGQPFAYLSYKVVGFAEVGTPIVYFALVLGCFVVGTGRWPSWRRGRDVLALAIATGALWYCAPSLPMVLFCRAYATNYVWACAIQLWFFVPARLALAQGGAGGAGGAGAEPSRGKLAAYAGFGVAAGMCNEHTGPALLLAIGGLALWAWRRGGRVPRLLVAGGVGFFVGFALIFFAPGQGQRYDGLAEQATLGERLLQRGFARNLDILQQYLGGAAPLLLIAGAVIVVGLLASAELTAARRAALVTLGVALALGVAITVTIFVSPKLGPRFYLHSCVALLAATLGLLDAFLDHRWGRRLSAGLLVLGLVASGYAVYQTVPLFAQLHVQSAARLARLQAQPRGAVVTVDAFSQVPLSWWFLGDDFRDRNKLDLVARYFDLQRVILRGSDAGATLGVTDVRLRFRAQTEPAACFEDLIAGAELPQLGGRDVGAMQHAFSDVVTRLRASGAEPGGKQLRRLDLEVEFAGERPQGMPEPRLYLASWRDGELLAFAAQVLRVGASRQRQVTLPKAMRTQEWEIYAYAVGEQGTRLGTAKQEAPLRYTPDRFKQHWILACRPGECFVLSARR
jgi:hypothetical protein